MNEHIVLAALLVVLLVGHLVVGAVCIYRMKQDWKRAMKQRQAFGVGERGPELFAPSTQMPRHPPVDPEVV